MLNPETVQALFSASFPEPHASLISGMTIGTPIPKTMSFYNEIKRTGLLHLVVLSGSNISILTAVSGSLLGFLHKKLAVVINICLMILFVSFVGVQAPILRAVVMAACSQAAILFGRRTLSLYGALIAFLFFAIWYPEMIPTLSFQLSFAASIGIILFGVSKPTDGLLVRELRPTLAAQAFTAPIIWFTFHEFSTVALISNLLISWTAAPIMLLGLIFLLTNFLHPAVSALPYFVLYCLSSFDIQIISHLSDIPFALIQL